MTEFMDESKPKDETEASSRRLLTVREVATWLRFHEKTIYDWAEKGKLPCFKIGNRLRFEASELR